MVNGRKSNLTRIGSKVRGPRLRGRTRIALIERRRQGRRLR